MGDKLDPATDDNTREGEPANKINNSDPVPNLWPSSHKPDGNRAQEELRNNIQDLSKRIDDLSKTYNEKLKLSKQTPVVIESQSVAEEPIQN